jgi:hypothetical protein
MITNSSNLGMDELVKRFTDEGFVIVNSFPVRVEYMSLPDDIFFLFEKQK